MGETKFENSVVVITGGTGSFGSTMVKYALSQGVPEIRILSRDEAKQDAMRHEIADPRIRYYIGDTRNFHSVESVTRGADIVFHAAALKQVPSAEFFPLEAVATNISGSANVLRASLQNNVASVVCLSTDKAVYPINAMGMSKALMEKTAMAFARENQGSGTKIVITRYGNVMYSRGSVIPLFVSQMKKHLPVTITNPDMTRFLMSLEDSVDLVRYAIEYGEQGDLFVRKAPASCISTLVEALHEIIEPANREVSVVGVRHGEKMFESLLSSEERTRSRDLGGFFQVPLDTRTLDYAPFTDVGQELNAVQEAYTSDNTERLNKNQVVSLLESLPAFIEAMKHAK